MASVQAVKDRVRKTDRVPGGDETAARPAVQVDEHIVEIISDSGEGAQTAGQMFGTVSAKMGNGVYTLEIIPAEIEPPARSIDGASGNRIRLGSSFISNSGDYADLVVAFNEQALLGRMEAGEFKPGAIVLLEDKWKTHPDKRIAEAYARVAEKLQAEGYSLHEVPLELECARVVENAQRGKNMFVIGMPRLYLPHVTWILFERKSRLSFERKGEKVINSNLDLFEAGHVWARDNLDIRFEIPAREVSEPQMVINGNTAVALGIVASGMDVCAIYPITPATSVAHYLSEIFPEVGGVVHQAEDEIAAIAFALGASYAGKCAVTVTSGPGMALKTELMALSVMGETPLVLVDGPAWRSQHGATDESRARRSARRDFWHTGRCTQGRDGTGDDRGLLLLHGHRP